MYIYIKQRVKERENDCDRKKNHREFGTEDEKEQ